LIKAWNPAKIGEANDVPPAPDHPLGAPVQGVPPFGSEKQNTKKWPHSPLDEKSETSGKSRTPSLGTPTRVCQEGLAQPAQLPLTTPEVLAAPVAQPLGPPLPPPVVLKSAPAVLLQNPLDPYGVSKPSKLDRSAPAQESFQGISGMYDLADSKVVVFVVFQYVLLVPAKVSPKSVPPTATLYGVDAHPLTPMPCVAFVSFASQLAAPSSPAETNTETPSVTAC
jgi:hypothetical protein